MESKFFDANFYRAANSDLSQFSDEQAAEHFQAYGLTEGRSFSSLIDLSYYRENNADLQGFDNAQLLAHLEEFGLNEDRNFSVFVDLKFYRDVNSDLAQYKGADALNHLIDFGLNEGRTFSKYVDLGFYKEANSDLKNMTKAEALQHLVNHGLKEKRAFSAIVDLGLYEDFNDDLKELKFNGTQLLKHLAKYGIAEGRQFSYSLDLDYYGDENPDLPTVYTEINNVDFEAIEDGNPEQPGLRKFLFNHFMTNGIGEGRRSSEEFDVNTYMKSNQDLGNLNKPSLYKHFQLHGINEERVFSDSYDAKYYKTNNGGNKDSNLKELFKYYITEGIDNDEFAVANPKFEREVIPELDLTEISLLGGSRDFTGKLSNESEENPYRNSSYANFYELYGIETGQQVTLTMTAQSFDTYLQIVDAATGDLIAENDNISETNKNSSLSFEVEEGIDYEVLATSINAKNLGDYKLTAQVSATATETVKIGDSGNISLTDNFFNPAREDSYREDRKLDLTGIADEQVVKVRMESTAFDPYLQLIDAKTGEVLAKNDNVASGSTTAEILFTRQKDVEYIVRFTSSSPDVTGSFSYSVNSAVQKLGNSESNELKNTPTNPFIAKDQTIWGILNGEDTVDTYNFDKTGITVGSKVKINLNSEEFDTILKIKDSSSNTVLFENDDISEDNYNSQLELTIEDGANYEIEVYSAFDDEFGVYDLTITPLGESGSSGTNNFGITLQDTALNNLLSNKTALNRANILEFFSTARQDGISNTEKTDLRTLVDKASVLQLSDETKFITDKVVTGITDNMVGADFDTLVEKYFFGTNRATPNYVGQGDSARGEATQKTSNFTYKTLEGDFFGSNPGDGRTKGQPRIRDVNQGGFGNCVYIASLGALFPVPQRPGNINKNSKFLDGFITVNGKETYNGKDYESWTFRFYNQSNPYYITVDRQVITKDNQLHGARRGGFNGTNFLDNDGQAIWVPIAEKAYAQFREEIDAGKSGKSGYTLTGNGDSTDGALKYITGKKPTTILRTSAQINLGWYSGGTPMTFDAIKSAVDADKIVIMGTDKSNDKLVKGHAFTLTSAYVKDGEQRIVVRNPWGSDGGTVTDSKPNDGFIDLSYEEFDNTALDVAIFERSTSTKESQVV
ncbi:MAG: C2 family cysteine protease [Cyanobacteria bacterium J06643_5]